LLLSNATVTLSDKDAAKMEINFILAKYQKKVARGKTGFRGREWRCRRIILELELGRRRRGEGSRIYESVKSGKWKELAGVYVQHIVTAPSRRLLYVQVLTSRMATATLLVLMRGNA